LPFPGEGPLSFFGSIGSFPYSPFYMFLPFSFVLTGCEINRALGGHLPPFTGGCLPHPTMGPLPTDSAPLLESPLFFLVTILGTFASPCTCPGFFFPATSPHSPPLDSPPLFVPSGFVFFYTVVYFLLYLFFCIFCGVFSAYERSRALLPSFPLFFRERPIFGCCSIPMVFPPLFLTSSASLLRFALPGAPALFFRTVHLFPFVLCLLPGPLATLPYLSG